MALTVSYASASEFVVEYGENLAIGGLFVPGEIRVDMLREIDVDIVLGSSTLRVRAKPVRVLDETAAKKTGRSAGTCMEITAKPRGFEETLRRHLIQIGKRREVAIMTANLPGVARFGGAGFRVVPLEPLETLSATLADALVPIAAIVAPPSIASAYTIAARQGRPSIPVYSVSSAADVEAVIDYVDRSL